MRMNPKHLYFALLDEMRVSDPSDGEFHDVFLERVELLELDAEIELRSQHLHALLNAVRRERLGLDPVIDYGQIRALDEHSNWLFDQLEDLRVEKLAADQRWVAHYARIPFSRRM